MSPTCPSPECMGCHIDWLAECQKGCAIQRFITGEEAAEARQREREAEFARGEGLFAREREKGSAE
jgi:hypothetical protein